MNKFKNYKEKKNIKVCIILSLSLILADQLTKFIVVRNFILNDYISIIDNHFNIVYIKNSGAAWGILQNSNIILFILGIIVFFVLLYFYKYITEGFQERIYGIFLILSGIAGNSIDRIIRGAVVDFIDIHYYNLHWPAFNIADSCICIGVCIIVISSLLRPSQ